MTCVIRCNHCVRWTTQWCMNWWGNRGWFQCRTCSHGNYVG